MIERSFGILKKRFGILQKPSKLPFKRQIKLIYALCGLSNFICQKDMQNDEEDILEQESLDTNKNVSEDSFEVYKFPSTNISQAIMRKRDRMANAMWSDYQTYL